MRRLECQRRRDYLVLATLLCLVRREVFAFTSIISSKSSVVSSFKSIHHSSRLARRLFEEKASFHRRSEEPDSNNNPASSSNSGPNWIERSFVVTGTDEEIKASTVLDYNLGIASTSYQTGPLAARMYQAMTERSQLLQQKMAQRNNDDDDEELQELQRTFKMIAMDCAAKEAVRAALLENGLEMVLQPDEEQVGEWGSVDSIRLVDDESGFPLSDRLYDDWEEVVDDWIPGQQGFDFVVRQVPAKMRALSLDELLKALDPKGKLRQQAKEAGMSLADEEISKEEESDDEDGYMPQTLEELANENMRRVNAAPREAVPKDEAFAGDLTKRGYRPINASALAALNDDGTLAHSTMMHVMDALVSHGCLLVDLTDGGTNFEKAKVVADMWATTEAFFGKVDSGDLPDDILGMKTAEDVGSPHAKVGFASYDGGNIQFLETRIARSGNLLPTTAENVLGEQGCFALKTAFTTLTDISKNISTVVIATSTQEVGALDGKSAVEAATKLVNELLDDGLPIKTEVVHSEGPVTMSPHRLCRYSNTNAGQGTPSTAETREVFGAHTDSTFITAVPVALVPGLEVLDEAEGKWYRPERAARIHWEAQREAAGEDVAATTEILGDGTSLPWCARYVVMMPGELLQLFSRSEVLAAVHRVVATQDMPSRLSAPILVRGRPGTTVDIRRYLGSALGDPILDQCEGKKLENIHDLMQVRSFQGSKFSQATSAEATC